MNNEVSSNADYFARGETVSIRRVRAADLKQISNFAFTVSIAESLRVRLGIHRRAFRRGGFPPMATRFMDWETLRRAS